MTIIWSQPASDSFYSHIEYLLARTPSGARNVKSAVMDAIGLLEHTPFMGRPGRWENTRELVIEKHPYIVAYRLNVDIVEILYIHHTRQDWPTGSEPSPSTPVDID
jgi:plasmid stabilization system protein ParE